jgi:hypothetical protein
MGIYRGRDFAFYISPKTGGTTIRSWIVYSQTETLELQSLGGDEYSIQNGIGQQLITNMGYYYKGFKEVNSPVKVCVKRDPVSRFLSCYTDKILREKCAKLSIDNILDDPNCLKQGRLDGLNPGYYLENHFLPQTHYLGNDKSYYDIVFDTREVSTSIRDFLSSKLGCDLPDLHTRKQKKKPELTQEQVAKIKELYAIDYKNQWC